MDEQVKPIQQDIEAVTAAAKRFGLPNAQQVLRDNGRGIDPAADADAIESAARRYGLVLPPKDQRRTVEGVPVLSIIWPGRAA